MGRLHRFECPGCGYEAQVGGGIEAGEACITETIYCQDCRELCDAVIVSRPLSKAESHQEPQCPKDAGHRVQPWTKPHICPRCGERMRKHGSLLWD